MINLTDNILVLSSTIIIVITATLLYFGKLIADTKVEKFERNDLLINGLFYTLLFLLFPIVISIFLLQKNWIINIPLWIIFIFHLFLMGVYSKYYQYKMVKKFNLESEYNPRFNKKIEEIKKTNSLVSKAILQKQSLLGQSLNIFDIIFRFFENSNLLFILSTIIFYFVIATIKFNPNVLTLTAIGILSFVNLSLIATAYGASNTYYPFAKIIFNDNSTLYGKIIKFGEYIYMVKGKKKFFVNKDCVKTIEQNLMKKLDKK